MAVDFETVGAAALAMATSLLPQWIGGKRVGHEWLGERKSNGGPGDSWKVNLNNGVWANFGGEAKGGDLISLYATLNHINNGTALAQVAALVGVTDRDVPVLPRTRPAPEPDTDPALPIPPDAGDLPKHGRHGLPTAVYRYGTAFAVARYDLPDGKTFCPWTWRKNGWRAQAGPDPKVLYNAAELAKHPESAVLVVEGEKCADAAKGAMRRNVVVTWAGGAQAIRKADWRALAGRDVVIWPDADDPGRKAAAWLAERLSGTAKRVRVINPNGAADGWDVAEAIAEGWDSTRIAKWVGEHIQAVEAAPESKPAPAFPVRTKHPQVEVLPPADPDSDYQGGAAPQSALAMWQELGLAKDTKQIPHATLSNASTILQLHPHYRGKIWLDSFRGKIYHSLNGTPSLWTDADSRRATAWIQQQAQLPKINLYLVQDAVMHAAECQQRNSLTDWLDSLEWDQVPRLDTWLADCLGADRNLYNDAVARNWPISMVARAYQPGCQVDTMPVLEGRMGRGKSSFLKVLADPWFASIPIAFGEKDFFQAIQGRWLIEVPDMSGFSKREHSQILATIVNREDVYRKSHGRITEEHPRVTVFAATSENSEYLQEARGRRRYWPLICGYINLETLYQQREQIFAEAVAEYRNGASWHEMPEGTDEQQLARASRDIWTDTVLAYANSYGDNKLTSGSILTNAIQMEMSRQDDGAKRRIYRIMMENGWKQLHHKDRYWKKVETDDI
jgi:predicted P-loop ATPase/5S rRNA maturation endonuclease (ribonuclease M5)